MQEEKKFVDASKQMDPIYKEKNLIFDSSGGDIDQEPQSG
jgi:hypothetical protein